MPNVIEVIKDWKKMEVLFTANAWTKIWCLVNNYSTEVGWNATVSKNAINKFVVEDVFVYPQNVDGAYIDMEMSEYSKWLSRFSDDDIQHLRFHGHSHVDGPINTSSTDYAHVKKVLKQINGYDDFYIFMIANKSGDFNLQLYNFETGLMYELNKDKEDEIVVDVLGEDGKTMEEFLADSKDLAVDQKYLHNIPMLQNEKYYKGDVFNA